MNPWNSLTTRLAAAPIGFIAGAVMALMWTGGHAGKSSCRAHARGGAALAASYHSPRTARTEIFRSVTVPAGQQLIVGVEGGLKSVVHDEASASIVAITALEGDRLHVEGAAPGEATVVVNRLDGGRATYRVTVLGADYQPYLSPCQKRQRAAH